MTDFLQTGPTDARRRSNLAEPAWQKFSSDCQLRSPAAERSSGNRLPPELEAIDDIPIFRNCFPSDARFWRAPNRI
jgi:hypothetical protein